MTITEEIEINGELLEVEFTGDCSIENDGIGAYEYWGAKCYDPGRDYAIMDDNLTWDRTKYTDEQNAAIEAFDKTKLDERFCEQFEQEREERMQDDAIDRAEYYREERQERDREERIAQQRLK